MFQNWQHIDKLNNAYYERGWNLHTVHGKQTNSGWQPLNVLLGMWLNDKKGLAVLSKTGVLWSFYIPKH